VANSRRRERQGILGRTARRTTNQGGSEVARTQRFVSGEELAERELRYVQAWLDQYSVDVSEDTDPESVKRKVFQHIENVVMTTYGL
jgi:AAA+ ATPase superfamily predicted ATPase